MPRYLNTASFEYRCIWISLWISLSSDIAVFAYRLIRNLSPTRFIRILLYLNIASLERHLLWMVPFFELRRAKIPCKTQGFWSVGHNFVHPYCLFRTPGPPNPVKYNDFETSHTITFGKVLKNHWFLQYFQPSGPPRWGQDGLQDEAKMGSKMSSKMGSKMGHFRVPKMAIPLEREHQFPEPVLARER